MRQTALLGVAAALATSWACVVPWEAADDTAAADTDNNTVDDGGGEDTDAGTQPTRSGAKPGDTCKDAKDFGTLRAGTFTGNFGNYTASGFAPDCGGSFVAPQGIDAFYRIDLESKQTVSVHFSIPQQDVVMYLTEGCTAAAACVDSADAGRVGGEEGLSYRNGGDAPITLYLGVALYYPTAPGGTFSITTEYTP